VHRPNLGLFDPYSATRTGPDSRLAKWQINELIGRVAATKSHPHSIAFAGRGSERLSLGRGEQH
jgi:hypothetical protein